MIPTQRRPFATEFDIRPYFSTRLLERFWTRVDTSNPNGCWVWTGGSKSNGYGQFYLRKGMPVGAHRVSLALVSGLVLPAGTVTCHACDNPPCVRPDHLFAGNQSTNTSDSVSKGRATRSRGEAHPSSKLTLEDVQAIRSEPVRYGYKADMARRYGVSAHTISEILAGRKWRHVP